MPEPKGGVMLAVDAPALKVAFCAYSGESKLKIRIKMEISVRIP
jgi:hypothetical protein